MLQHLFHCRNVQLALIPADDHAPAVMVAFEDKLLRQGIKIDFIGAVPRPAHQRDQVLRADLFGYILPHCVLIHQLGIQWLSVVKLQPLELLVKGSGVFQIERISHLGPEGQLQIMLVIHPVQQMAVVKELEDSLPAGEKIQYIFHSTVLHLILL